MNELIVREHIFLPTQHVRGRGGNNMNSVSKVTSAPIEAWKFNFSSILRNYERLTDQLLNQQTDMRVYEEVKLRYIVTTLCKL